MARKRDLYTDVVDITADYLGPAAQRFIDRQIHNHLHKPPEDLNQQDLSKLIDWLRISIAFLTEDRQIINELTERLSRLKAKRSIV